MNGRAKSAAFSRRALLRGAGVCLALPLMESLGSPSGAKAATPPKRFLSCYFPNGAAAAYWPVQGKGSAFTLSPVLEPLKAHKERMVVFSNMENYSSMREDPYVEPSHARLCGAFLTCVDSDAVRQKLGVELANGISVDQVIGAKQTTKLRTLELGLSTLNSYEDGRHPALSRSIAWASTTQPLYKEVNPQAVFDRLLAAGASGTASSPEADKQAARRRALKQSALDFVLDSSRALMAKLGRDDKPKLEEFMSSVRDLESRVAGTGQAIDAQTAAMCSVVPRPPRAYAVNVTDGYNRGTHADVMSDLIVMALRCDVTRVITHMLDDARSDFVYDHLENRKFTAQGSTAGSGKVGGFHGLQHAGDSNDGYATINWWFSSVMASLCDKLAAVPEGEGSLLDYTLIQYGGAMHGSDHDGKPLPMALIGGTKAGIRGNQHVDFTSVTEGRPLRDLYFTLLNGYFGLNEASFGSSTRGLPNRMITEILG
jgi:hypothetical protein